MTFEEYVYNVMCRIGTALDEVRKMDNTIKFIKNCGMCPSIEEGTVIVVTIEVINTFIIDSVTNNGLYYIFDNDEDYVVFSPTHMGIREGMMPFTIKHPD